jgi:uncharacterized membrane protein YdfJ with MMPL/SSD domain
VFVLLITVVLTVLWQVAVAFRSWTIPLASILPNLLSIGAARGVLTWIFQDGNLESVLGFHSYGGVISWLPLFMFVILFGLSMDYPGLLQKAPAFTPGMNAFQDCSGRRFRAGVFAARCTGGRSPTVLRHTMRRSTRATTGARA